MIYGSFRYGFNSKKADYELYLPNSCFVESVYFSSKASLVLKITGNTESKLFLYRFKDVQPKHFLVNEKIFGHAIVVFEYQSKLWIYDPNYGTMFVGLAPKSEEDRKNLVISYIEETQEVKIIESFFINDWRI